jgi:hypothetical protein
VKSDKYRRFDVGLLILQQNIVYIILTKVIFKVVYFTLISIIFTATNIISYILIDF